MSDMISREAAIAAATSCPDSHWGPWIAERIRALPAVQPDAAFDGIAEREIDALRLKAFRTNAPSDRETYFMAVSKWFQDRHYRYIAVQPDAAAYREAALREAADSLLECSVWRDSQERTDDGWRNGVADARKYHMARIQALIDKPGEEVMPSERPVRVRPTDTAPAGLSAGGGDGWQPIETAPKDGIAFLGYWPDVSDFGGADNACEVRTWWNETEQRYESPFETGCGDSEPTHWMPRPAPPATDGGA